MATVSGLRICPHCEEDLSELGKGKVCPTCHSDAIIRLDRRREFLLEMQEKGFSPLVPVSTQLRNRVAAIEKTPMPAEEQKLLLQEARKTAGLLISKMPSDIKKDLLLDALSLIHHGILDDPEAAGTLIGLGIKIGKLCENLDQYMQLRFKR